MKKLSLLASAAAVAAFALSGAATADTLSDVPGRGTLNCGVKPTGLPGFAIPDDKGKWTGLDVDMCRAIAAAVLGDATKVKFVPLDSKERFTALQSGEIDILARNTTWTFSRDTDLGLDFVGSTTTTVRASWYARNWTSRAPSSCPAPRSACRRARRPRTTSPTISARPTWS